MIVIGMISGTSFDAIEAAAGEFVLDGDTIRLRPLGAISAPYPDHVRGLIAATLPPAATNLATVCQLDTWIGQTFAEVAAAVNAQLCDGRADLISSHGQNLYHWVEGRRVFGTLQLGQPAWIAEKTGLPVVSDLRARDVAAGGQGAPLASTLDVLLLGQAPGIAKASLNLGGIANITVVQPDAEPIAFDTGPASCLLDAVVADATNGASGFDRDGERAARGRADLTLLDYLLAEPYYRLAPPKSTGRELFSLDHVIAAVKAVSPGAATDDLLATLAHLTARTVADACRQFNVREIIAAGGGTKNPTLMRLIADYAPGVAITPFAEFGLPESAKEAYLFALLGFLTANGLPATVASCTGARHATRLGRITPGAGPLRLPEPATTIPQRLVITRVLG